MKIISKIFLGVFATFSTLAFAVERPEIVADSHVAGVTVYTDRAVVERKAAIELPAGGAKIVFSDLPESIDRSSLQVRSNSVGVLEDIVFQVKYYSDIPDDKIRSLSEQKDLKDQQIRTLADALVRFQAEKGVLLKMVDKVTAVKEGSSSELSPEKWAQFIKFYTDRLAALDTQIRATEIQQNVARNESLALKQQLDTLGSGRQKKKNQALVVVDSQQAAKGTFTLSYVVIGPSWKPSYDVRVDSEKGTMDVSYNAELIQNTGEDWSDVALKLSTARVEVGGRQPDLSPWYLSTYQIEMAKSLSEAPSMRGQGFASAPAAKPDLDRFEDAPSDIQVKQAVAQTGGVAVLFLVPGRSSIVSDNTSHRVAIVRNVFPSTLSYSATPKLSAFAYVKASVKNTSEFPFLAGRSKVFLDGNFVSESSLDFVSPGQEFKTDLGVDESIKVEYNLVKNLRSEEGLLTKSTRHSFEYEIVLTNTKKTSVDFLLLDQIPIPSDSKITVKLLEPRLDSNVPTVVKTSAESLEWRFKLAPSEKKIVKLSYYVEYPVGLSVEGL